MDIVLIVFRLLAVFIAAGIFALSLLALASLFIIAAHFWLQWRREQIMNKPTRLWRKRQIK